MALCRLMIDDFRFGHEPDEVLYSYPTGYNDYDLKCGMAWARGWLEDGKKIDPYFSIDLRTFIKWCKHKLRRKL